MKVINFKTGNKAENILRKFIDIYLEEDVGQEAMLRTRIEFEIFNYLSEKYPEFEKQQNIKSFK